MDRKSMRRSPPPIPRRRSRPPSNPDVFSDEHALETFDSPESAPTSNAQYDETMTRSGSTRTPLNSYRPSQSHLNSLRRNSNTHWGEEPTSPSSGSRYSQSIQSQTHNGQTGTIRREPSDASTSFLPRAQSPYQGATGPSHPYAMYSQNQDTALGRTPSNATVSTARGPLQNYSGPSGPSHPYGMYAQNTVSEEDLASSTLRVQQASTVAPGQAQPYQRQQGPDGEDADDLIGPDGHTEQLPPYTKYPNDLPPKERSAIPERNTQAVETPLQDSQETLHHSPGSYEENRSLVSHFPNTGIPLEHQPGSLNPSEAESTARINQPNPQSSSSRDEGGNFKEVVAPNRKRRICGISSKIILIMAIVILIIIVIGATVGGIYRHKHWEHEVAAAKSSQATTANVTVTVTSLIDAEPVATTPGNLPTLPPGTFTVPLNVPSPSSNNCLENVLQRSAWSCVDGLNVSVVINPGESGMPKIKILSKLQPNVYHYGPQPPHLDTFVPLSIMNDKNDRGKGPAYFFEQVYNKIVIVKEEDFAAGSSKRQAPTVIDEAEGILERDRGSGYKGDIVQPSDQPWFCYWNGTILEGFIYANQTNDDAITTLASTSVMSVAYESSDKAWPSTYALQSRTTMAYTAPSTTGYYKRQATGLTFPKSIKLEERRIRGSQTPYCQQMRTLSRQLVPLNPDHKDLLDEDEPLQQNRLLPGSNLRRQRGDFSEDAEEMAPSMDACQCQWVDD